MESIGLKKRNKKWVQKNHSLERIQITLFVPLHLLWQRGKKHHLLFVKFENNFQHCVSKCMARIWFILTMVQHHKSHRLCLMPSISTIQRTMRTFTVGFTSWVNVRPLTLKRRGKSSKNTFTHANQKKSSLPKARPMESISLPIPSAIFWHLVTKFWFRPWSTIQTLSRGRCFVSANNWSCVLPQSIKKGN